MNPSRPTNRKVCRVVDLFWDSTKLNLSLQQRPSWPRHWIGLANSRRVVPPGNYFAYEDRVGVDYSRGVSQELSVGSVTRGGREPAGRTRSSHDSKGQPSMPQLRRPPAAAGRPARESDLRRTAGSRNGWRCARRMRRAVGGRGPQGVARAADQPATPRQAEKLIGSPVTVSNVGCTELTETTFNCIATAQSLNFRGQPVSENVPIDGSCDDDTCIWNTRAP